MNKKSIITLFVLVLIIVAAFVFVKNHNKEKKEDTKIVMNKDFIFVGNEIKEELEEETNIITSYEEYQDLFDSEKIMEEDFTNHNYLIVEVSYDSCADLNVLPTDYKIKKNKIDITIKYERDCGVCPPETDYYLLKLNKSITNLEANIDYKAVNSPDCPTDVAWKPIIYLYPEYTMDVSVKLGNPSYLTSTYPKYKDSWEVIAYNDGKLINKDNNRELYGLYWEGNNHIATMREDGFVVKGEDTISFLEEKLSILGLTEREADEFIIFWLPQLEKNNYNYIRFETKEEIDNYMPLDINPKPDTVIRVLMDYKPLDNKINIKEQELSTPTRNGFTVVEWGGSKVK